MGVYIKNIEMPKNHNHVTITIWSTGAASYALYDRGESLVDYRNVEAVTVPPHGRLGDLDAFESIKYELPDGQKAFNRGFHSGVQYVQRLIMDAPTVLEAEPPKEET